MPKLLMDAKLRELLLNRCCNKLRRFLGIPRQYAPYGEQRKKASKPVQACLSNVTTTQTNWKFRMAECGRLVMYQVPVSVAMVMCWKWHGGGGEARGDGGVALTWRSATTTKKFK